MSARRRRRWGGRLAAVGWLALWPLTVWAQTAPAPRRASGVDLSVQAQFAGPVSFGTARADLTRPDGTPYTLFSTDNSLGPGLGAEAHLGFRVAPRVTAEASGSWARANLRSETSGDAEGALPVTATDRLMRVTVEAAALVTVRRTAHAAVFVRGSAGWLRELAGSSTLSEDGAFGSAGGGLKYWWTDTTHRRLAPIGVRLDGRVGIRSGGVTLGPRKVRVAPELSAGIILGI